VVLPVGLLDPGPGPEVEARDRQALDAVLRALQAIPEVDRVALLMRAQDGLPYNEIAAVLGLSLAAVRVKVHRARLRIAELRVPTKDIQPSRSES
jgi:RNA polymerase sigma-70 factor (ECF subfamily)